MYMVWLNIWEMLIWRGIEAYLETKVKTLYTKDKLGVGKSSTGY